jgi:DNA-binding PadR family transcriptional regulator
MPDEGVELGRYVEPAVLVLASLSDGPKHGYAIMADVDSFSGLRMGPGTLYAVLARLEQGGLVDAMPAEDRRRPYRLTAAGSAALAERLDEMARFVKVGRTRLRQPERGEA